MSEFIIIYFMEVENKVKFTYISKIFVENLHKWLHKLQYYQLIFIFINDCYEVQTSESFVYYLPLFIIQKITHLRTSSYHHLIHLHSFTTTYFNNLCFSDWLKFIEYHLVRRDRPWRLIKKKQWIIFIQIFNYNKYISNCQKSLPLLLGYWTWLLFLFHLLLSLLWLFMSFFSFFLKSFWFRTSWLGLFRIFSIHKFVCFFLKHVYYQHKKAKDK